MDTLKELAVVSDFENDELFKQFLQDDFDVKTFTSNASFGLAIAEYLSKLTAGISSIDKELNTQVEANYNNLLSQANGLDSLEGILQMIHTRIQSLSMSAQRLQLKISEPYVKVESQTRMLVNLQKTCDILRRVIRIMNLTVRLQSHLKETKEIAKASQVLNELFYVMDGVDLTGIEILENDQTIIASARKKVEEQARLIFQSGIKNQNQLQIATALQVFHNLDTLNEIIAEHLDTILADLQQAIQDAVDVKLLSLKQENLLSKSLPGRPSMPIVGNMAAFRASLWSNVEELTNKIYASCNDLQLLVKVLLKKKDPVSHLLYIDELAKHGEENLMRSFWERLGKLVQKVINETTKESSYIRQTFENEYPKMLCSFLDLCKRIQQGVMPNESFESLDNEILAYDPEKLLRKSIANFEKAYLQRSESRLRDSVNVAFSMGELPSKEDIIHKIIKAISSELTAANVDSALLASVSQKVTKTIGLFVTKCEELFCEDGDAIQVIGPVTKSQSINASLAYVLNLMYTDLSPLLQKFSLTNEAEALAAFPHCIHRILKPLVVSVSETVEKIILTIHQENFAVGNEGGSTEVGSQCSLYMRELQSFLSRVNTDYFQPYPKCEPVTDAIHRVAERAILLFLRHIALVRPLGDGGKLKMAADFAQLEMALASLRVNVGELGKPYKLLRAFKPLLFQTPAHIGQSSLLGDVIPHSLVLEFLFSRGPENLRSPHEVAGWTLQYYSKWLDDHPSEPERLTLIRGTLESYVQAVKQSGDREFCSVYPIMVNLLQRGLAQPDVQ